MDTGPTIIVWGFERRFGAFSVETSTRVMIDMLQFRRKGTESIDEALALFKTFWGHVRAQAAGFDLPVPVLSWLLLEAIRVPRRTWPLALMAINGWR